MQNSVHNDLGCLIRFIPAGAKASTDLETKSQSSVHQTLSGEEAKTFYEELLKEENLEKEQNCEWVTTEKIEKTTSRNCEENDAHDIHAEYHKICDNSHTDGIVSRDSSADHKKHPEESQKLWHDSKTRLNQSNNKLLSFSQNGDLHQLRKLCEREVEMNIDYKDQFGWTALMCSAVAGHLKLVKYLLSKGANRYLRNNSGKTAVELSTEIGAKKIVKLLNSFQDSSLPVKNTKNLTQNKQAFYCKQCKSSFIDSTEKEHSTSTVHLFNLKLKPKPDPFSIPESNIGYQLMRSSGWDGEKGLGPEGKGSKYPVKTVLKTDRRCLGADEPQKKKPRITHFGPNDVDAVRVTHKHSERVLSARASSRKERKRRENKEKHWEKNLRQYWDMDCESIKIEDM